MSEPVWSAPFEGARVAVLADCHIHPGDGPAFPPALFEALAGVDLIVTLGDMGEAAGLDQLAQIAPVMGVRGADDSDDPRTSHATMVLTAGAFNVGCIFDAKSAGLASSSDPFTATPDFDTAARRVFGREVDMLLFASTHKPGEGLIGPRRRAYNPGSAVLPAEGSAPTFLRLTVADGSWMGEFVQLA